MKDPPLSSYKNGRRPLTQNLTARMELFHDPSGDFSQAITGDVRLKKGGADVAFFSLGLWSRFFLFFRKVANSTPTQLLDTRQSLPVFVSSRLGIFILVQGWKAPVCCFVSFSAAGQFLIISLISQCSSSTSALSMDPSESLRASTARAHGGALIEKLAG